MSTLESDFCKFEGPDSGMVTCTKLGVEWPPPEKINLNGTEYQRVQMSKLTDEQATEMSFVARGAMYTPVLDTCDLN
jgi:hypothetical protein